MKRLIWICFLGLGLNGAYCQNWEKMAVFTTTIKTRDPKVELFYDDSTLVEIRDFGIHQFTLFNNKSTRRTYFIYQCNCRDNTSFYVGGTSRSYDFWQSVYIENYNSTWLVSPFYTEIALSDSWDNMKRFSKRKRCFFGKQNNE